MQVLLTGANGQARGLAVAAARAGHSALIYDPTSQLGPITLPYTGGWGAGIVEARVIHDIAEAADAGLIVINDDLHARAPLVEMLTPRLGPQHVILLNPGGFGGGAMLSARLRAAGAQAAVAELAGFPLLTEQDDGTVTLEAMKHDLPVAVHPPHRRDDILALLRPLLPTIVPADSALEVGLDNSNHFIHPPLVLLNAIRIDRAEPYRFYREGLSAAAQRLVYDIDRERLALAARLDIVVEPLDALFDRFYATEGMRGPTLFDRLGTFAPFERARSPLTLQHRYVLDDVSFGLVPIARVCERVGVAAPRMRATIDALGSVCARDFWSEGVTLESLRAGDSTLAALLDRTTNGGAAITS